MSSAHAGGANFREEEAEKYFKEVHPDLVSSRDIWHAYLYSPEVFDLTQTSICDVLRNAWSETNGVSGGTPPTDAVFRRAANEKIKKGLSSCLIATAWRVWLVSRPARGT